MSVINRNGVGNLLISYKFKKEKIVDQVSEEAELKVLLRCLLESKGYRFIIADDEFIDKKLLED